MARVLYLVTYDVADDVRRTRIARVLEGYGERLQYSVFRCALNAKELTCLRALLFRHVHHTEDQVLIVRLGPATNSSTKRFSVLGKPLQKRSRTQIV